MGYVATVEPMVPSCLAHPVAPVRPNQANLPFAVYAFRTSPACRAAVLPPSTQTHPAYGCLYVSTFAHGRLSGHKIYTSNTYKIYMVDFFFYVVPESRRLRKGFTSFPRGTWK